MGFECGNTNCDYYELGYCKCSHTVDYCKTLCCNKANWKGDEPTTETKCKWYHRNNQKGCRYPNTKKDLLKSVPAITPLASFCRGKYGLEASKKYCSCYEKGD